ncbi:MAG: hypothetical protein JWR52_285 [Marmoricola sp.]|nr:hypothetical protein [Marmoricola sp.]
MWLLRAVWVTVLFLILTACGSAGHQGQGVGVDPAMSVLASSYVVTGVIQGGAAHSLVNGSELRLQFANDRLTITAGCNTMSGAYRRDGNRITVGALASTEMGCAPALMTQDAWVAGLFAHPVQLAVGKDATQTSGDVVLALADVRTVSPARPLVGTRWLLKEVYAGATASSVPHGDVAWVRFGTDGTVRVNDGLNDGSGPVRVIGDRLVFGDLLWSAVGCARTCAVGNFGAVFAGTSTFAITGDSLVLTHGTDGLGFRAVEKLPPQS